MTPAQLFNLPTLLALLDSYLPRLLTQIDRDPDSPTFGSVDRGFWMYRLHDFDSGVVQQAGLTLAALAELARHADLSGYRYLRPEHQDYWRTVAAAVNRRTVADMGHSGLLDEYYPGEQSFPGTIFASYAVLKSALLLGQQEIIEHPKLQVTARSFLARHPSPAANQDTAAAAFLALYSQTHGWETEAAQHLLQDFVTRPDDGGAFVEYGGLDLGYATVTLNYLAYMHTDGSFATAAQLDQLARLIAGFISPAGRLGGEFASRSTTYFLPYGLLQAARLDADLAAALAPLDLTAAYQRLDDRYLMHYCLPSLALAALDLAKHGQPTIANQPALAGWRTQDYPELNLFAARSAESAVFVGLNKGGAFQVEVAGATTIDTGYRVQRGGKVYATCVVADAPQIEYQHDGDVIAMQVTADFQRYGLLVAGPLKTIALRLISFLGPLANAFFKRVLIKNPQVLPEAKLIRQLALDTQTNTLTVTDKFTGLQPGDQLTVAPPVSFRVVPSARFYQPGEVAAFQASQPIASNETRTQQIELK